MELLQLNDLSDKIGNAQDKLRYARAVLGQIDNAFGKEYGDGIEIIRRDYETMRNFMEIGIDYICEVKETLEQLQNDIDTAVESGRKPCEKGA